METNGSMHLSEFMEICLYNYDYGYYSNISVVGRKGDFITSPEISQVFGDKGKHTRAAVSVNSLPLGAAVEVDGIFEL